MQIVFFVTKENVAVWQEKILHYQKKYIYIYTCLFSIYLRVFTSIALCVDETDYQYSNQHFYFYDSHLSRIVMADLFCIRYNSNFNNIQTFLTMLSSEGGRGRMIPTGSSCLGQKMFPCNASHYLNAVLYYAAFTEN